MAKRSSPRTPHAELEELRARYRRELPDKVRAVQDAARAFAQEREASRLETLYLLAHRLRGSAAIYGFAGVSEAAAAVESLVADAREGTGPPSAAWLERLEAQVAALTAVGRG
jgi:chemotaxis protein histidine kinase CheA